MVEAVLEVPEFLGASLQPNLNSHWRKATPEIKEQHPDPLGNPKRSWARMRAENPSHGQERVFTGLFPKFWQPGGVTAAALECSQTCLLQLFPSPALQLHWGVTGAGPAVFAAALAVQR